MAEPADAVWREPGGEVAAVGVSEAQRAGGDRDPPDDAARDDGGDDALLEAVKEARPRLGGRLMHDYGGEDEDARGVSGGLDVEHERLGDARAPH